MRRRLRTSAVALGGALVAMAALGAGPAVGRVDPDRPGGPGPATADLHGALDRTGAFRGADGLAGIVDPGSWSLVSDLAAGEAPRFARARRSVAPAGVGQWSAVGPSGNTSALNGHVLALTADSDLFVGGDFFNTLGAPEADNLARWDGSAYSGFGSNDPLGNTVRAIAVIGDDLYVGGTFQDAAGIAGADRIAKWDGSTSTWSALGNGLNAQVRALAVSGNTVYVAGDFTDADGIAAADYIAKWDGSWSALGSHNGNGALADQVHALAVSGSTVYAGGLFTNARGRPEADYVARFDGSWTALGSDGAGDGALSDIVYALLLDGSDLYVGGDFVNAGNAATADFVARWDGGSWAGLGSNGSGNGALDARVHALAKSGPDLYVGGHFLDGAGIPEADRVAMWDGGSWSALGSNGAGNGAIGDTVYALAVFDGDLYAGGVFFDAAGIPAADHLARFGLAPVYQPDGRVRIGTTGAFTGNDIYNANGNQQGVSSRGAPGTTLVFQLSLQNDAPTLGDRFTVSANGNVPVGYEVRYFKGTTEITNDVIAGTYQTPRLRPGRSFKIKVEVTVAANAPAGSKVTRKVTVTSVGDAAKLDVVKVTGRRS